MKRIALLTLLLAFAATLLADGSVTVINNGSYKIEVRAYNWDDRTYAWPPKDGIAFNVEVGQSGTVHCWKNAFDSNPPGCRITIVDADLGDRLVDYTSKENGTYSLSGTWDWVPDTSLPEREHHHRVANVDVKLFKVTPIVELPGGAVSLSRTFDKPKPAANSTILQTGSYRLDWQSDGNLVVYRDGATPVWASNTNGAGAGFYFGSGGDLKIYGSGGFNDNKWGVPTYKDDDQDGLGGDRLFLFPDGNLLVLNSNNRALWQTGAPQ